MTDDEQTAQRVRAILMKYCVPKKEYDMIPPAQVVSEIIAAVRSGGGSGIFSPKAL